MVKHLKDMQTAKTYNTQMNEGTVLAGTNVLCKQINNDCCMLKDVICTEDATFTNACSLQVVARGGVML